MAIRNAAKALVVDANKVLLIKYNSAGEILYMLPGGGQKQYETIEKALKRECLEETGYTVDIRSLAAVFEELPLEPGVYDPSDDYAHKVHFVFRCELSEELKKIPMRKDLDQLGEEWVEIDRLPDIPLYPPVLKENISKMLHGKALMYLDPSHY